MNYFRKLEKMIGKGMNTPLYKLAENKELPDYQFMDMETLLWISKNIPSEIRNTDYSYIEIKFKKKINDLIRYIPKVEWFENELVAKGIHGVMHLYRITVYLLILNLLLNLKLNKTSLCFMGLFHDIRRINDKNDDNHGIRSAEWIKNNKDLIEVFLNKKISDRFLTNVILSVSLHDIREIDTKKYNKNQLRYIYILKTSDALDRYRLPKIKWWPDDNFLAIKPPLDIKAFAFNFILLTENDIFKFSFEEKTKCFLQT